MLRTFWATAGTLKASGASAARRSRKRRNRDRRSMGIISDFGLLDLSPADQDFIFRSRHAARVFDSVIHGVAGDVERLSANLVLRTTTAGPDRSRSSR